MTTCTCGRAFTHCRACGFKAVYRSKIKSMSRSIILGRPMDVFTCPRCGSDTDETDECSAGSFKRRSTMVIEEKVKRPEVGSPEYLTAANERLEYLTQQEDLTFEKAIYRMKHEGWVFEEPVPQAEVVLPIEPTVIEAEPAPEITLDDVLAKMKEQASKDAMANKTIDLERILKNMGKK